MPVLTYQKRLKENEPAARSLIEEGYKLLDAGDQWAALACYIKAADMTRDFPADHALKAARIALSDETRWSPRIEGMRIAACFFSIVCDSDSSDLNLGRMYKAFENVLNCWKRHNIKPQQHLISTGEGGKSYLLELQWNEGGEMHESVRDNPGVHERVKDFLKDRPLYAVSLDTLIGWRPFSIMPVGNNDNELLRAIPFFAWGGISYYSPRLRPLIVQLVERKGTTSCLPEFPEIPATMNWYGNHGYLGSGFGRLEGLPEE